MQTHNLLITGGAGFIGLNFVLHHLEQHPNNTVINVDKLTYAAQPQFLEKVNSCPQYHFVQADITDQNLMAQLLEQHEVSTVIHFAAESHVDRSISGPADFIHTNVNGTFSLLEACRNVWGTHADSSRYRFHHISTDEVYGSLNKTDPAFTEQSPYRPNSPYSASKASSDHLVRAYYHTYGLPVTISNCSNNYGPYQHPEKLIPTIIRCALAQQTIPIYGDGSNIRDWLYVTDHCLAIDCILSSGQAGEVYNVGGECEIDNLTLAKTICALLDELKPANQPYSSLIQLVTDRPGHDWRYAIDINKITSQLDWKPEIQLEEGLRQTIAFYLR